MSACPFCGGPRPTRVSRGPLTVEVDPPALYWRGLRHHITRHQALVLMPLVRWGEAGHPAIFADLPADTGMDAVKMLMARLRARLRAAGIPVTITSRHGWGYALTVGEPA